MHGGHKSRSYNIWIKLRGRCENPNDSAFVNYGGRGIKVCERWSSFANFYADMGDAPKGMTVERVNNNDGYSPTNCVWADRRTQGRNKRNNVLLTISGKTAPLSVFAENSGLKYSTVHQRIMCGWSPEEAVTTPLITKRVGIKRGTPIRNASAELIRFNGEMMTLAQASFEAGLNYHTVCVRLKRGWPLERALKARPRRGQRNHGVQFGDDQERAA